ncbi:MAG: hypothetical protein WBQ34_05135 [Candidatus Acidiferrales bacterium]
MGRLTYGGDSGLRMANAADALRSLPDAERRQLDSTIDDLTAELRRCLDLVNEFPYQFS